MKQIELANQLGISKSYLSMILSRQRKCPPELLGKLQSIPGVHKVVNNGVYEMPSKQVVTGSSPVARFCAVVFGYPATASRDRMGEYASRVVHG